MQQKKSELSRNAQLLVLCNGELSLDQLKIELNNQNEYISSKQMYLDKFSNQQSNVEPGKVSELRKTHDAFQKTLKTRIVKVHFYNICMYIQCKNILDVLAESSSKHVSTIAEDVGIVYPLK